MWVSARFWQMWDSTAVHRSVSIGNSPQFAQVYPQGHGFAMIFRVPLSLLDRTGKDVPADVLTRPFSPGCRNQTPQSPKSFGVRCRMSNRTSRKSSNMYRSWPSGIGFHQGHKSLPHRLRTRSKTSAPCIQVSEARREGCHSQRSCRSEKNCICSTSQESTRRPA